MLLHAQREWKRFASANFPLHFLFIYSFFKKKLLVHSVYDRGAGFTPRGLTACELSSIEVPRSSLGAAVTQPYHFLPEANFCLSRSGESIKTSCSKVRKPGKRCESAGRFGKTRRECSYFIRDGKRRAWLPGISMTRLQRDLQNLSRMKKMRRCQKKSRYIESWVIGPGSRKSVQTRDKVDEMDGKR